MKKIFLMMLFSVIILTGCTNRFSEPYDTDDNLSQDKPSYQDEQSRTKQDVDVRDIIYKKEVAVEFNSSHFLPKNAKDVKEFELDINGDGQKENVVFYKSDDVILDNQSRTNQHLKVYQLQNNQWQVIKEDIAANNNVGEERFIRKVEVIDIDADNKQELLVVTQVGRRYSMLRYYVFGLHNAKYQDLPINKVYLDYEKYLQNEETGVRLTDVSVTLDGQLLTRYEVFNPWPDNTPGTSWYSPEFFSRELTFVFEYNGNVYQPRVVQK